VDAVSSLVAERVSFRVTSVDRVFVAGYIPGLQYEGGVVRFLLGRGYPIPSPAGWRATTIGWSPRSRGLRPAVAWR
jgi:hypothetical protein